MALRDILRMGDARLWQQAQPVTEFDSEFLHTLVADMKDTMLDSGGVGLAAPQIGESVQVVVFGFEHSERYPDAPAIPWTVLINPELEMLGDESELGWEGCLSVPGLRGEVPRARRLRYRGYDVLGQRIEREVEGFHARVVQHECDHLWGVLYPMRMKDMRRFGFTEVLQTRS